MSSPVREAPPRSSVVDQSLFGGFSSRTDQLQPSNALPRANPRASCASMRSINTNTQPTYDFLSGQTTPPAAQQTQHLLRQSIKPGMYPKPPALSKCINGALDFANEDLRAEIRTLQYELSALKQDRELTNLRHEKELREIQKKAEADFKRAQASDSDRHVTSSKYEPLVKELEELRERAINDKSETEKKLRVLQDQNRALTEEVEEAQSELSSQERQHKHQLSELETRKKTLQQTVEGLREDLDSNVSALQTTQHRLSQKEADFENMEGEMLRLKAQTGDVETLAIIRRELSEQVAHIKKLESANRDQLAELKYYRKLHKSVEVVEEEKRVLESKVRMMEDLRRELSEVQLQRQILEDERRSWTTYLQNEASIQGELEFDTPEEIARALVQERLEKAALVERIGALQPELDEKDQVVRNFEAEKVRVLRELEKLRVGGGNDGRVRMRLERQRTLAVKEVEYLREQLKTFDAEENTFQPGSFDVEKTKRIQELEDLVDQYRKELHRLSEELAKREQSPPADESSGTKRPREEDTDERIGQLARKNRKLQDEVSKFQQSESFLRKELEVHRSRLSSLELSSRTRILQLRDNPTAIEEGVKLATLTALREENRALLAQIEGRSDKLGKVVPISTLENARMDIRDMEKLVAEKEKRMMRLKQIWGAKSLEFREAVASVLGWKMDFMPNGRVRVTSMFYPGDGDEENSIIFDGENGTMKVSGGPNSLFALEIKNLITFWVEGRKEIPCFLAAMTLEFYEKTTRAALM
ncbi:MAG: coiled-coil domain-containing protein mad1 [Trichoglossum hirsutum]|nr:MAG: coiled-coil domain-containing protein mad1 [Trichoglossum hirsutum]